MTQDPKVGSDGAVKHALTISGETFEFWLEPLTPEELEEARKHADEIGMTPDLDDIDD